MGLQCKGNKKRPPNKQSILERPEWKTDRTAAEQTVTEEGEQPCANWVRLGKFRFEFNIFQTFKYWKASLLEIPNLKNPESEMLFSWEVINLYNSAGRFYGQYGFHTSQLDPSMAPFPKVWEHGKIKTNIWRNCK